MDNFSYIGIVIIIVLVVLFMYKNKKAAQKEINSLSEVSYKNKSDISFDDIAGNYEAKKIMKEIVDFIRNPNKYEELGIRLPKGIMLYGTPGTGKTLLAKALASEAGVNFYAVSGSDFVQVYAGLGASRIRNLFKKAKKSGSSVIFIDEIDAIGKKRLGNMSRGSEEGDRTLNALLSEMSGFENSNTVVVAATNRIDVLDEALLRPGRFDKKIEVILPDKKARKDIIKIYLRNVVLSKDIDLEEISDMTVYFSGAMLENLVNEAKFLAIREKSNMLMQKHFHKAFITVLAGAEKTNHSVGKKQKEVTAFHEAGHTFITKFFEPKKKIVKVSIIPTTKGAGGYTLTSGDDDSLVTKIKIENQIKILLAGRGVEEVIYGIDNITVGAQNDIEKATKLVIDYLTKFGMDSNVGLINYRILQQNFNISFKIEEHVKRIIEDMYTNVINIIKDNINIISKIANELYINETIDGDYVDLLIKNFNTKQCV